MRRLAFVLAALAAFPLAGPVSAQRPRVRHYRAPRPRVTYQAPRDATGDALRASARCRDGTLSYSAHRRGTCSHHGGVAVWLGLR